MIEENCGDGYYSLKEGCDDNNNEDGDGCSNKCTIEKGWGCRLKRNEGPSECYDILGWDYSL